MSVAPDERGRRNAWLITIVVVGAMLVISAIVFAISAGTRSITTHSEALHLADEALRVSTAARAQLGFAVHLAAVEREFGTDTSTDTMASLEEADAALTQLAAGIQEMSTRGEPVPRSLLEASVAFDESGRRVISAISQGDSEAAEMETRSQLGSVYETFATQLADHRDLELARVASADAFMARLGDVARFLVALLIPLAVLFVHREIVRRQQRQAELEVRLEAEKEVGRAREEFLANASHEFRTPLTSIYGLAQIVEDDEEVPGHAREMAHMISTEASDLSRMVEDLLTSARLDAGALSFHEEQVMAHEEAEEIVQPLRTRASRLHLDVRPAIVRADRLRQRQVLRNLLSNAIKYGGDHIELSGRRQGQWYRWTVADDGPGIPAELESRLFERFIHRGTTVVVPGGVGLGLSIVRALVDGMGGEVEYERADGWTRFHVDVPLAAASPVSSLRRSDPGALDIAASTAR